MKKFLLSTTFVATFALLAACSDDSGVSGNSGACSDDSCVSSSSSAEGDDMIDPRDGQTYKTVTIGTQTWMAQNLNYAPDENHVHSLGDYAWSGCYDNEISNCAKYGHLYTWEVAMDKAGCDFFNDCMNSNEGSQGICPVGWHLPSKEEWETLFAVSGGFVACKNLKSASGWREGGNGTDAYGFSALPAGKGYGFSALSAGNVYFNSVDYITHFWSSSEFNSTLAYIIALVYNSESALLVYEDKNLARSVRCLKDN
ncbi:MAG: fibrobacter succinogenes major paralogous domain-containing protein [Fibrobacter sp.]|nr:fibrobacter succinogenes major paralogous domain-containing protein [Fibrobacter sp.]